MFGCEDEIEIEIEKSAENDIITFYFPNRQHEMRMEADEITVFMFDARPVDNIVPVIEVSDKARVSPASHVARDFSNDVSYTVTAENGAARDYTVRLRRSSDKALISFSIPNHSCDVFIYGSEIFVDMLSDVDVSKLTPIVVVSEGATVDPPLGATVDFSEPVEVYANVDVSGLTPFIITSPDAVYKRKLSSKNCN